MLNKSKHQLHYEIRLYIEDKEIIDINYTAFIRCPIIKTSTSIITKCYIPQKMVRNLMQKISINDHPIVDMEIYIIDESSVFNDKPIDIIYQQRLVCIGMVPDKSLKMKTNDIHVRMLLVHPILYSMETTNIYNKILENISSYGALKKYESWVTKTYGKSFDFKHIGMTPDENPYVYEQILVKTDNDLNVPNYLMSNYKVGDVPGFYFFDNFFLYENDKKEIVVYFVNLSNMIKFKQEDVTEYPETYLLTKRINETSFSDTFKKYDKLLNGSEVGHVFVGQTKDMKYSYNKKNKGYIYTKNSKVRNVELDSRRKLNISCKKCFTKKEISSGVTNSTIYIPDNVKHCKKRFYSVRDQFLNKIRKFVEIEITNTTPFFPKFGYKYNFRRDSLFDQTPLSIVNIFTRKNEKEYFLELLTKCKLIQFEEKYL